MYDSLIRRTVSILVH